MKKTTLLLGSVLLAGAASAQRPQSGATPSQTMPPADHMKTTTTDNALLKPFSNTPHQTPPYDKIRTEQFMPAIEAGIAKGRQEIQAIANSTAKPTFSNTILALEDAGEDLSRVTRVMGHLNGAETTPELQKVVKEASPLLTEYGNDISLNEKLFARVRAVWDARASLRLDTQEAMLLEKTYKSFARNGASLNAADKLKLRDINKELSQLSIGFNERNLAETNEYALTLTDEKDLAGLPDFVREAARATAKKQGREGYVFTLQAPSYLPFMQYADNRDLRQQLYTAFASRGFKGDKNDNREAIGKIVKLRHEKARLLGYNSWADYVLEERMAASTDKVQNFLENILQHAKPAAERDLKELTDYARSQGFSGERLERWDVAYYQEKLKKEKFAINDEILKPYFRLENVLEGIHTLANRLYGVTFKENKSIPVWHPEVRAYEMFDKDGRFLAVWYGDYFPRPGKRAGAWNTGTLSQHFENGKDIRPHVINVCNFTRPTDTKPSLLTLREVETLFHEFGHALHAMLSEVRYSTISGTSVTWDFVELPSQIMENFVHEPEVLRLFAKHYQTGEPLPDEYIQKIIASTRFMAGLGTSRQVNLGLTDMAWHSADPTGKTVESVEGEVAAKTEVLPLVPGTAVSPAFLHIFAGGYSAGYYSYQWAAVLDADAFEAFREQGIFSPGVSTAFRSNVLSKGGSEKPMELYKRFRGREPKPEAMLRRLGLL